MLCKYSNSQLFLCVCIYLPQLVVRTRNVTLAFTGLCKLNLIILAHLPVERVSMSQMSPLKLALIGIHVGSLSGMAIDTR